MDNQCLTLNPPISDLPQNTHNTTRADQLRDCFFQDPPNNVFSYYLLGRLYLNKQITGYDNYTIAIKIFKYCADKFDHLESMRLLTDIFSKKKYTNINPNNCEHKHWQDRHDKQDMIITKIIIDKIRFIESVITK